jgi:hypothetical protein
VVKENRSCSATSSVRGMAVMLQSDDNTQMKTRKWQALFRRAFDSAWPGLVGTAKPDRQAGKTGQARQASVSVAKSSL